MWKRRCLLMMGFCGLVCLLLAGVASTEQPLFSFLFLSFPFPGGHAIALRFEVSCRNTDIFAHI